MKVNFKIKLNERSTFIFIFNVLLVVFQFAYLTLRYAYLNDLIPFWYTKPWGDYQLSPKINSYFIPVTTALVLLGGLFFIWTLKKYYVRYATELITLFVTSCNIFLTYSLLRVIKIGSSVFVPIVSPVYVDLIVPFAFAFFVMLFTLPAFIDFLKKRNIVTNPAIHNHPGMLLQKPSARGGGFIFALVFLLTAIIFVPTSEKYVGIYLVMFLLAVIGLLDDYQNTHPKSRLSFLEKPLVRLMLLFFVVSIVVFFGIKIDFIGNPLGGIIDFNAFKLYMWGVPISPIAAFITVVWIVWVLNVLSWSNGIDGQYAGIVGIAAVVVALLALRFVPLDKMDTNNAKLAIIAAGATFGLLPYTWHPSKIMWGFGAMSAAFILSSLSILISSKVATSIMIILIPFLDALVITLRRILQKQNPLKGDWGHLHHILIDRGWGIKKIAVFYWISTAFFGILALLASGRTLALLTLTSAGVVAFILILLNLRLIARKQLQSKAA